MNKLVNGKIPVGSECPYKEKCSEAMRDSETIRGACGHKGKEHTVAYSCGYARLFAMIGERK